MDVAKEWEKEWALECGRILKKVAPIIEITVTDLEKEFKKEIKNVTGIKISEEKIHKLLCGERWSFYNFGIIESKEAILRIAKREMAECDNANFEKKICEIKKIVYLAFADFDHLSYFHRDTSDLHNKTTDLVDRIMDNLDKISKLDNKFFLYIFHRHLDVFLSINFLDLDILLMKKDIMEFIDFEIPLSIKSSLGLFNDPMLQQWLELRNNNHKDAFRKVGESGFIKKQDDLKKRLNKLGFSKLLPLTCFIEEFLIEEKQGNWNAVTKEDLEKMLVCK